MKTTKQSGKTPPPLRYAHPFFTSIPPALRPPNPHIAGKRMSDWTIGQVGPIPPPKRTPLLNLEDVIGTDGVNEINQAGAIRIHAVGDTGRQKAGNEEDDVAIEMTKDYHPDATGNNPAFFLHLGDVIYGTHKELLYRDEFYRPYKDYPGKILAIAGNHDGETFPGTDPNPCEAFLQNFCADTSVVPPIAKDVGIFRETMTEHGVYWLLDCPFVQIIGLYSNIVDGPGYLVGKGNDNSQIEWLAETLKNVSAERSSNGKTPRKALLVAVHHPPYSSGGHKGSPEVLSVLDQACQSARIMPDAILSGHAHNYQRYTRRTNLVGPPMEIPYIVAGCGGHNALPVPAANGQILGDHSYDAALRGYGYLIVTVGSSRLKIEMFEVPSSGTAPYDSVTLDLGTNRLL
jgi:hypothetical protein